MNLVSGASGFIGRRLIKALLEDGLPCRGLSRMPLSDATSLAVDLGDKTALTAACAGATSVFHCAGHAHAFGSRTAEDVAMHWQVNCEGTRNLVEAAGIAGVRRFVFLSSVKAMAEPGESCADYSTRLFAEMDAGLARHAHETCAVIVEPLVQCAGNMRMYDPEYLRLLRAACDRYQVHLKWRVPRQICLSWLDRSAASAAISTNSCSTRSWSSHRTTPP